VPEQSWTFAECLRQLREAADLTQYALAKRTGLSKQALSRLEMGEREPTWTTVQKLALALGVDCRQFVDPTLTLPATEPTPGPGRPRKQPVEAHGEAAPRSEPAQGPSRPKGKAAGGKRPRRKKEK
jgi:transcriptional regulator with XRE-family HTH domain